MTKLGTVSAAANALGFYRATVNRHIDVLEEEMGARIFIRHARGYTLTELGEDVLRVAQKTEEIIEDLAGRVQGGKAALEGELKLTILAGFAELIMKPISDFRAENPNCIVNLDASENLAKLEYGEAHIALRAGPKPDHPDYVVSNFAQISFNLYAHDSYIQRFGMSKDTGDFGNYQFVLPPSFGGNLSVRQWIKNIVRSDMIALSSQHVDVNCPSQVVLSDSTTFCVVHVEWSFCGFRGSARSSLVSMRGRGLSCTFLESTCFKSCCACSFQSSRCSLKSVIVSLKRMMVSASALS